MANLYFNIVNGISVPLTGKKVSLTPYVSPAVSGAALTVGDTVTEITDASGVATFTNCVSNSYLVEIVGANSRTLFYLTGTPTGSGSYNANEYVFNATTGTYVAATDLLFNLIDLISDPFAVRKVALTPQVNPFVATGWTLAMDKITQTTASDGTVTFEDILPTTYKVECYGPKTVTTFYVSPDSAGGVINAKDYLANVGVSSIEIPTPEGNVYGYSQEAANARFLPLGATLTGFVTTTGNQDISGTKNFVNGLHVSGIPVSTGNVDMTNVVLTSGNQTISGTKTFTTTVNAQGLVITDNDVGITACHVYSTENYLIAVDVHNAALTNIDYGSVLNWSGMVLSVNNIPRLNWYTRSLTGTWDAQGLTISGNPVSTGTTVVDDGTYVRTTGTQNIGGSKNFTGALTFSGNPVSTGQAVLTNVVFTTGVQTVSGKKEFKSGIGTDLITEYGNMDPIISGRTLFNDNPTAVLDWQNGNMTGTWNVQGLNVTSSLKISGVNVATGTGGGDADTLDGQHGTYYRDAANTTGTLNDLVLSSNIIKVKDCLMPTNPFGGRSLYLNQMHNAFFQGAKRWYVSGSLWSGTTYLSEISQANLVKLFDGNYDNTVLAIPSGQWARIYISGGLNMGTVYPYGNMYVSYYYDNYPASGTVSVDHQTNGITGTVKMSDFISGTYAYVSSGRCYTYNIVGFQFDVFAQANKNAWISQIDWQMDRPVTAEMPFLNKFRTENLYETLNFKVSGNTTPVPFSGDATGLCVNINADLLDFQHGAYYRNLGNLTGTHTGLVNTTGAQTISGLKTFANGMKITAITGTAVNTAVDVNNGILTDTTSRNSIRWSTRELFNVGETTILDYATATLYAVYPDATCYWSGRVLKGTWTNSGDFKVSGQLNINEISAYASADTAIYLTTRQLWDDNPTPVLDWQNRWLSGTWDAQGLTVGSSAVVTSSQTGVFARSGNAMGTVVHGSNTGVARPNGYLVITWIGSVEPALALDNDLWVDTT